jgi:hypothetical protein
MPHSRTIHALRHPSQLHARANPCRAIDCVHDVGTCSFSSSSSSIGSKVPLELEMELDMVNPRRYGRSCLSLSLHSFFTPSASSAHPHHCGPPLRSTRSHATVLFHRDSDTPHDFLISIQWGATRIPQKRLHRERLRTETRTEEKQRGNWREQG